MYCLSVMRLVSQKQAAEDNYKAEDEKAKRKEIREERNKIQERIEEAKKLSKRYALQRFWHGRRLTRHW